MRWPAVLFGLGWASTCIALAGPTWERLPQTAYKEPSRTILVLGLTPSMNQRDVAPSRLARARHKLQDALDDVKGGSVALVVYREEAYPAVPLTDDREVLREMIPLLSTDLAPGSRVLPVRGLEVATRLLGPVGLGGARVLLVTDGADDDPEATRAFAKTMASQGVRLSVLSVAGENAALSTLASVAGGVYSKLTADDGDLDRLLGTPETVLGTSVRKSEVQTDEWRDMGAWLVWVPILLAPLAFRKGWAAVILLVVLIQLPANDAQAGVRDWFERADQRGSRAFSAEDYDRAARSFENPEWRAAAHYRAGDFAEAAAALEGQEDATSDYNRGNALAKDGKLEQAVAAYDEALAAAPEDEDARYNRSLVQKLLDKEQQKQDSTSSDDATEKQENADANSDSNQDKGQSGDASPDSTASDQDAGQQAGSQKATAEDRAEAKPESSESEGQKTPGSDPQSGQAGSASEAVKPADSGNEEPSPRATAANESAAERDRDGEPNDDASGMSRHAASEPVPTESDRDSETGAPSGVAPLSPQEQEMARWMGRLPDDPAGLLREKIRRDYLRKREARQMRAKP